MNLQGDTILRLPLRGSRGHALSRRTNNPATAAVVKTLNMKICLYLTSTINDFNKKQSRINKPVFDIPYLFDLYQRHHGRGGQS